MAGEQQEQNVIQHPTKGTLCYRIWGALNDLMSSKGKVPSRAEALSRLIPQGFRATTVGIQYRAWLLYHGHYTSNIRVTTAIRKITDPSIT